MKYDWRKKGVISLEARVTLSPDTKASHWLLEHPVCVCESRSQHNFRYLERLAVSHNSHTWPSLPLRWALQGEGRKLRQGSSQRWPLLIIFLPLSTHHHWQIYVKRLTQVAAPRLDWLFPCCEGVSGRSLLSLRPPTPPQYFGFYDMYFVHRWHMVKLYMYICFCV